jgi:hypothetical protein
MSTVQNFIQWLIHNPLGAAALPYITGVIGVLLYSYFEPGDEHQQAAGKLARSLSETQGKHNFRLAKRTCLNVHSSPVPVEAHAVFEQVGGPFQTSILTPREKLQNDFPELARA